MSAKFAHRFVRAVPERLEEGILYVSVDYVTSSHLCACGCGAEVVLPLHPTKWRMTFDGVTVTMSPSIGSRTLPCRSHYLIVDGRVLWADPMTDEEFDRAYARDRRDDERWHGTASARRAAATDRPDQSSARGRPRSDGVVGRLRGWFGRRPGR